MKLPQSVVMRTLGALFVAMVLGWIVGPAAASENRTFVTIGTGGFDGLYFRTGRRICKGVNRARADNGLLCSVESTAGSIHNLNSIRVGGFEIGLAQSDWQYHAYQGTGPFEKTGPFKALRSLFSLYPEAFTVLARADSGIKHVRDLKGKRVNIGHPGSGHRATIDALLEAFGWDANHFALALELESSQQAKALCDNKVDAIVFTVGHPNRLVHDAAEACDTVIVEVRGPAVSQLMAGRSYYRPITIPGGMYRNNPLDIKTFGVDATVVSSSATEAETVYQVVKTVFENFQDFKRKSPILANLSKGYMIKSGLSAPLHVGAARYYRETGLLH